MKIVYCTGALYNPGGAERVLINKANYLANQSGHEVFIITAAQLDKDYCYAIDVKVKLIDANIHQFFPKKIIPYVSKKKALPKIIKHYQSIIDTIQPDIIIVNELGYDDEVIPRITSKAKIIREFHSSHIAVNYMIKARNGISKFKTKLINQKSFKQFNKFDAVVLLTEKDREYAHYATKVVVIPNMLLEVPQELNTLNKSKRVISVGRLDDLKNHKDQIRVWKQIASETDWNLHIYGDGILKNELTAFIKELNLESRVFLEGASSNIMDEYLNSSIFLFTPKAEGFGMVLIEAMSAGLPCVSYDYPCGASEIIQDGKSGFLIEVGNIDQIAEKLKLLINNDDLRTEMAKQAKKRSLSFYPEHVMPKWEHLFKELIQGN